MLRGEPKAEIPESEIIWRSPGRWLTEEEKAASREAWGPSPLSIADIQNLADKKTLLALLNEQKRTNQLLEELVDGFSALSGKAGRHSKE